MGFRSGLKGGGGLFNGDGTLRQFTFSAIAPGEKKAGEWAYIVLAFQADGKEKVDTQHLFLGGADQYSFEEGGDTATSVKDGEEQEKSTIGKKTPSGLFFLTLANALEAAGLDVDALLPDLDAGEPLNFDGINGLRVTLEQEKDVKGTATRGQRVGSDGNKYDRTNTIVGAVLAAPDVKAAVATKGKPASGKAGAKGAKQDNSIRDAADKFMVDLIESAVDKKNKTGETPVSKLKMAAFRTVDKSVRDAVTKLVTDEAYRTDAAERGVFNYDAEAETVSIDA